MEAAGRDDSLGKLPFPLLPLRKIGLLLVVAEFLSFAQQVLGDDLDFAGVQIHEVGGLVELLIKRVDNVFELNGCWHRFETIIIRDAGRYGAARRTGANRQKQVPQRPIRVHTRANAARKSACATMVHLLACVELDSLAVMG